MIPGKKREAFRVDAEASIIYFLVKGAVKV
jgi:hypothetical protein